MFAADPAIVNRPPWVEIVTCVGAVGGGTYDYLGYVGLFREKGWGAIGLTHDKYQIATHRPTMPLPIDTRDENIRRGRRWLLPSQVDVVICFTSVFIFSMCFVILGAKILHPERLVPAGNNLFNYQANFLTRLHPALLYLYQLGIFCAFFGTIYGAYEVYFRTAFECLMPVSEWFRRLTDRAFPPRDRALLRYAGPGVSLDAREADRHRDARGPDRRRVHLRPVVPGDALGRRPLSAPAAADAVAAVAAGCRIRRRADVVRRERNLGLRGGVDCEIDGGMIERYCISTHLMIFTPSNAPPLYSV